MSNETTTPTVSVVMATYNRADMIGETISSILNQTFSDLELIIVSDGSTDDTESVVASYGDPRIRFFTQENSGRPAVPRNNGIRQARGKYIAFCDDDDPWLPEKLERQLRYFPEEGISCLATECRIIGECLVLSKPVSFAAGEAYRDFSYVDLLYSLNPVIASSVLARRDFVLAEGGFDESTTYSFIEDWEFWLRLSKRGEVRILSEPLVNYRMYQKEGRDARKVNLNMLKLIEKHERLGLLDAGTARVARANCSVVIGRAFLEVGDRGGIPFYLTGLYRASSATLRMKAMLGLGAFVLPNALRRMLFRGLCRVC